MTETFDNINLNVDLNNIIFKINNIIIKKNSFSNFLPQYSTTTEIEIFAETSNSNYIALGNWIDSVVSGSASKYKKDINSNGIFIGGMFPMNYYFDQWHINVRFSADYFRGDLSSFKLKQLRKAKLKRLNEISCQQ